MTVADMISLISWVAAAMHTGDLQDFEVRYVPHSFLEAHACDKPCRVIGWTDIEARPLRMYLQDDQRENRSLFVHETCHVAQISLHKYADLTDCAQSIAAERECYALQNEYLVSQGEMPQDMPKELTCRKVRP